MSVDDQKTVNGNSLYYSVEIFPNKCKFTTEEAFAKRNITLEQAISDNFTGDVNTSGGDPAFFANSNPYLKINNELMKVSLQSSLIGFDFNGTDNRIDIPALTATSDFELIANVLIREKTGEHVLFSGFDGFRIYVSAFGVVNVDYPLLAGGTFTIFGDFVSYGSQTELRVKRVSDTITVTINGNPFFDTNSDAKLIQLTKIGSNFVNDGFFDGSIADFKFYDGGDEGSGTLVRDMPINDGFSANPVISELTSSQNGTVFNALITNWPEGFTGVSILSRGDLGTETSAHAAGPAMILHSGEADGTCYGFPRKPNSGGCSSPDSFDKDTELSMLFPSMQLNKGEIYFNGLDVKSLSHRPTTLKPGESIATRSGFSCTIIDYQDEDTNTVPPQYADRRTSNATLFKKLFARHPHLENRRLIFRSGFIVNGVIDESNVWKREYIIDKANLSNGKLSISALDPLILSEESKAKAPIKSNGVLEVDINNSSTQIHIKDFYSGEYGDDGDAITVRIDKELISCTVNNSTTGILDIVSRAVQSKEADHKINASVQLCIKLENFNPVETIDMFWRDYTGMSDRFHGDYSAAIAATPNATGPVYISTPTSVEKLVNEIIRTWSGNGIVAYYDEITQKNKIKASSDFSQQPVTIDYKTQIERESTKLDRNIKNQFTRATTSFSRIDSGEKPSDDNSSISFTSIGADVELTGLLEPNSSKDFVTRFLSNSDSDVVIAVSGTSRIVNINKEVPSKYTFKIDYESYGNTPSGIIEEGEIINIATDEECNEDGTDASINVQIISLKDNAPNMTYTAVCQRYQDIILEEDFDFVINEDKENYDLSTEFAPTTTGEYTIFIKSGVTIGATSVLNNAFTTGVQAAGVTFKITHRGSILAAGGSGANGPRLDLPGLFDQKVPFDTKLGYNGNSGGDACNFTVKCEIDTSQGVIYAGGAGAPSTKSTGGNYPFPGSGNAGNGGSGGQGYIGGGFGRAGTVFVDGLGVIDEAMPGNAGSRTAPGTLASISGGAWGSDSDETANTGSKGLSGFAIKSNGNSVIITGDNELTVRGRRS